MKITRKIAAIGAAAATGLAVLGGGLAYAASGSGPAEAPGGTYFQQGAIVNFCFTHGHGGWLEFNTTALGNCPPGDVQLSVWADPSGIEPAPAPTVTVTVTPSPSPA